MHYGLRDGPFPEYKVWKDLTKEKLKELKKDRDVYWDKLRTNPREFYLDGVTDSIALILDFGLIDVAAGKAASLGKAFSNILEAELAFLTDNTKMIPATTAGVIDVEAIEVTQAPVLNSFKMVEELNCKVVQYGGRAVDNALKIIEKNPELMILENGLADTVDLVATNEVWELKGLLHVGKGKFRIGTQTASKYDPKKFNVKNNVNTHPAPEVGNSETKYFKQNNNDGGKIQSVTKYGPNGKPEIRLDYTLEGKGEDGHFSKAKEGGFGELKNHKHIFKYNEKGQRISRKVIPID